MKDTRLQQIRALVDEADRIVVELSSEIDAIPVQRSLWWHLDDMRGYLRRVHNKTKHLEAM